MRMGGISLLMHQQLSCQSGIAEQGTAPGRGLTPLLAGPWGADLSPLLEQLALPAPEFRLPSCRRVGRALFTTGANFFNFNAVDFF